MSTRTEPVYTDERVAKLFTRQSRALQFCAFAITAILGKEGVDAVVEMVIPTTDVDWNIQVPKTGLPLIRFVATTRQSLIQQSYTRPQIDEIRAALAAVGRELPEGVPAEKLWKGVDYAVLAKEDDAALATRGMTWDEVKDVRLWAQKIA